MRLTELLSPSSVLVLLGDGQRDLKLLKLLAERFDGRGSLAHTQLIEPVKRGSRPWRGSP